MQFLVLKCRMKLFKHEFKKRRHVSAKKISKPVKQFYPLFRFFLIPETRNPVFVFSWFRNVKRFVEAQVPEILSDTFLLRTLPYPRNRWFLNRWFLL